MHELFGAIVLPSGAYYKILRRFRLFFAKMGRRQLRIDWSTIAGASTIRKKINLVAQVNGVYKCPYTQCLHVGFKSKRGCRKHIDTKHQWLYYFEDWLWSDDWKGEGQHPGEEPEPVGNRAMRRAVARC